MFLTLPMRYIQLIILEKDFQQVIDLLGEYGWIEIRHKEGDKKFIKNGRDELIKKLDVLINEVCNFFELKKIDSYGSLVDINEIESYFLSIYNRIKLEKEKLGSLTEKKIETEKLLNEVEKFKNFTLSKEEIESFEFIYIKIVSMAQNELERLKSNIKGRLLSIELDKDLYVLVTSKKGRWTLESELKKFHFKEVSFPSLENIIPMSMYASLKQELIELEKEINEIKRWKSDFLKKEKINLYNKIAAYNLQKLYFDVFKNIDHLGTTTIIEGWILKEKVKTLSDELKKLLGNRIAIIIYKPEEVEEVKKGELKIPVLLKNFGIFKAFEKIVLNYGAPEYNSIDPTIFVAFSFLSLFGLMFGDMGQGFVILIIGIIINFFKRFKLKEVGQLLILIGCSAIFFGYLYGSAFCFEHEELPFLSIINKVLFNYDKPYFIYLSFKDPSSITNLFLLTILFGVVMNLIGMLINSMNNIIKRNYIEAIFSRTGVCGFFFLLSLTIILVEFFILKTKVSNVAIASFLTSLFLIFLKEPFETYTHKKKFFEKGIGIWFLHVLIELIEIILMTMSNNLSFIRVGAFAFAHFLLSLTTVKLATTLGGSVNSIIGIIIIILGNCLIIFLEGMIVAIQTIRLEYYEFFSKFFVRFGKEFNPFKIYKHKLEEFI